MRDIQKTKRNYLFWALLLSVGFPAGIVMIVLGFSNGMLYVAIPGIVLVVAGFYVMPMLWMGYGNSRYRCALHQSVIFCGQFNTCPSVPLPTPAFALV